MLPSPSSSKVDTPPTVISELNNVRIEDPLIEVHTPPLLTLHHAITGHRGIARGRIKISSMEMVHVIFTLGTAYVRFSV